MAARKHYTDKQTPHKSFHHPITLKIKSLSLKSIRENKYIQDENLSKND